MGNKLDILIKCITLLYREKLLDEITNEKSNDTSKDIIRNVLETFKSDKKVLMGGDAVTIAELQSLILDMLNNSDNYSKDVLLQSVNVVLKDNESTYTIIDKAINADIKDTGLKNSIVSLRKFLITYYKQVKITRLINKASYDISTNSLENGMQEYVNNLVLNLEALNSTTKVSDPGVVDELDFTNENSIEGTIVKVKDLSENKGKLITGWKEVNRMLNGKHNLPL